MIDVCGAGKNGMTVAKSFLKLSGSNFRYANYPTDPIEYLRQLGSPDIYRFIATHLDMDHLDGFDALANISRIFNLWDSSSRRPKPSFAGGPYREVDWNRYAYMRDSDNSVTKVVALAGARFPDANLERQVGVGHDGLHILAPSPGLVALAHATGDYNDSSYVILYHDPAGKVLFTGDAHDDTFDYVLNNYEKEITNCSVLIAPHHGRHSDREFEFLDVVNPTLTLFGYAPAEHLAYQAWASRGLEKITSNQSGDVVFNCVDGSMHVYVENPHCAYKGQGAHTNAQGYHYFKTINPR